MITPPIDTNHLERLESLLEIARSLGFTSPVEGATHIHFDATPLYSARVFANLVNLLWTHGANLRRLMGTNSKCRRLGTWSLDLLELVQEADFRTLPWCEATRRLTKLKLTKYCDFNLKNLIHPIANKSTFEARIFPVWLEAQPIVEAAALIEAILRYCITKDKVSYAAPLQWQTAVVEAFLDELPMSEPFKTIWKSRAVINANYLTRYN